MEGALPAPLPSKAWEGHRLQDTSSLPIPPDATELLLYPRKPHLETTLHPMGPATYGQWGHCTGGPSKAGLQLMRECGSSLYQRAGQQVIHKVKHETKLRGITDFVQENLV